MSELSEARAAIEAYLRDNDLDEKETELTLTFNHGSSSIQGNLAALISAIEEALDSSDYWHLEVWDQDEDTRQIIATLQFNHGGLWDFNYSYAGS